MNEYLHNDTVPTDWRQIPREDWLTHLTLYVFAARRELRLYRQSITLGSSRFRDLDLSSLPGGSSLEPHHGTFFARNGSWFLRIEPGQQGTCLNGRQLLPGEYPLQPGDCLMLNRQVFLAVRECGFGLVDRSHELDKDIELYNDSKSLVNGHAASRIYFDAARRMIVTHHWSMVSGHPSKNSHSEKPVPDCIRTKKQLLQFSGCDRMYPFGYPETKILSEDVLLWLSPGQEVVYLASEKKVIFRQWDLRNGRAVNLRETPYAPRWISGSEKELRDQVRKELKKKVPHNRPGELDDDFSWGEETNHFRFSAEARLLTRETGGWNTPAGTGPEQLSVPDWVQTPEQLKWIAKVRRPDWFTLRSGESELLTDRILQRGQMQIDGRILDYETRYTAENRTVIHTRQDARGNTVSRDTEPVPAYVSDLKKLKDYVRRQQLYWIN